jgi:hypothetical protein
MRGAGEQALSGISPAYTGRVNANSRPVLRINGNLGQAEVGLFLGATMRGSGSVGDLRVRGAVLRPGNNGGTLNTGKLGLDDAGTLLIDLVSSAVGGFGKINAVGAVLLQDNSSGVQFSLQLAAAPTFAPAENVVFEIVSNDGVDAVSGTFKDLPEGATISAGSRNFVISYTGGTGNDITLTEAKTIDIDGDGKYLAETDGLLISRYVNNLTGPALTAGAVAISGGARRTSDDDILAYLNHISDRLGIHLPDKRVEARITIRYLFGFRGEALVADVPRPPVYRDTAQFVEAVTFNLKQLTNER